MFGVNLFSSVWLFLAYKDLQTREDIRNAAWHKHGWEELVYYTGNIVIGIKYFIILVLLFYDLSPCS